MKEGVSVIICCYNSEWIIERCLKALIEQKFDNNFPWEIILVNNASTDKTVEKSYKILQSCLIEFSIIEEKTPGLLAARKCGVYNAKYSYIIFCDDDNILCSDYVCGMFNIMHSDSSIGAYGGIGVAEFGKEPDSIIHKYIASYAIGSQKNYVNRLYGAGICVRKDCVEKIYSEHNFVLIGRCGDKLLAGDDSELVKTIIMQGYKIGSTDELTFIHVLPAKRLTKEYLCNMYKGFGTSAPVLYIYDLCLGKKSFHLVLNFYFSMLLRYIVHCFISLFKNDNKVRIAYLKYTLKGFHYWGIKGLRKIYKNSFNYSSI